MTREEALDLIAKRMAFSEKDVAVCRAALDALTSRAAEDAGATAERDIIEHVWQAAYEAMREIENELDRVAPGWNPNDPLGSYRYAVQAIKAMPTPPAAPSACHCRCHRYVDARGQKIMCACCEDGRAAVDLRAEIATLRQENEALRVAFDKQRALANDAGGKLADALIENEALRRERDAARDFAAYLAETVDIAMTAEDPDDWNARGLEALERVKTWVNELAQEEARPDAGGEKLPQPAPCPTCTTMPPDSSWRWAGDCWQHKCPNIDPNAGHFTMPMAGGEKCGTEVADLLRCEFYLGGVQCDEANGHEGPHMLGGQLTGPSAPPAEEGRESTVRERFFEAWWRDEGMLPKEGEPPQHGFIAHAAYVNGWQAALSSRESRAAAWTVETLAEAIFDGIDGKTADDPPTWHAVSQIAARIALAGPK